MIRAKVPLEQLTAGLRALKAATLQDTETTVQRLQNLLQKGRSPTMLHDLADMLCCAPEEVEQRLQRLLQRPLDLRLIGQQWGARQFLKTVASAGAGGEQETGEQQGGGTGAAPGEELTLFGVGLGARLGLVGNSVVTQRLIDSCPESAVEAMLMALGNTHPPLEHRIARTDAAARAAPMLLRYAGRPLGLPSAEGDGASVFLHGRSVAERLAERLEAGLAAEAAAKLAQPPTDP